MIDHCLLRLLLELQLLLGLRHDRDEARGGAKKPAGGFVRANTSAGLSSDGW
jgi:hypothetical protein